MEGRNKLEENRLPKIHTFLNLTTNRRSPIQQISGLPEKKIRHY